MSRRKSGPRRRHRPPCPKAHPADELADLYTAAVVSSRFEPILRGFYQNLLKKGKPKKLALTAVMRKLLIDLNSLMRKHLEEISASS
ncbi:hypothetical protein N9844_01470 [Akkermansiaceae bacterium]|nr:hypothetical protein [Akkermansiaceae bacterium]